MIVKLRPIHGLWANRTKVCVSIVSAIIFGYLMLIYLTGGETHTQVNTLGPAQTMLVQQVDGGYTVAYKSTGPVFSSFSLGCEPSMLSYDFGPPHNCLILNNNGKAGIVELKISNSLISEFQPIGNVRVFYLRTIPFQIIGNDDYYTVLRIDIPAGYNEISVVGGVYSPGIKFVWASLFGFIIFILTGVIYTLCVEWVKTLKIKRSRKWESLVNRETANAIRELYRGYLGVHSIAKKLELDVGIVIEVLKGYGIK